MGQSTFQVSPSPINYRMEICFRIAVFILFLILEAVPPFMRDIQPEEIWLYRYPKVSHPFLSDLGGPIFKLLLEPLAMVLYPLLAIFITWYFTGNDDEMYQMYLIPTLSIPLTGTVVNLLKVAVGRPRPNFMSVCYGTYYYLRYSDASRPCTGSESLVLDGRKSFPSGHTALAFASFGFIILYIGERGKRIWLDKANRWKVIATFLPLILLPTLVGVSRTCDYKHHWQDVLVGGLIGILVTCSVYVLYCPGFIRSSTDNESGSISNPQTVPIPSPTTPSRAKSDGRTHSAQIRTSSGGVASNMAEAMRKLNYDPIFLSAVGNDLFGRELMLQYDLKKMDKSRIYTSNNSSSAIYSALLNNTGECLFGMGDMSIHNEIGRDYILHHLSEIQSAPIVILDGNIPVDTISTVLQICSASKTPVWFEPTEIRKAQKICNATADCLHGITYISPNINELRSILSEARNKGLNTSSSKRSWTFRDDDAHSRDYQNKNKEEVDMITECFSIFPGLQMILMTKGKSGITVNFKSDDNGRLDLVSYDAPKINHRNILSVSGAGDCLNAGFISGILQGLAWIDCARIGTQCASASLQSLENVPDTF